MASGPEEASMVGTFAHRGFVLLCRQYYQNIHLCHLLASSNALLQIARHGNRAWQGGAPKEANTRVCAGGWGGGGLQSGNSGAAAS
jgi:hypothetical protein